VQGLIHNSKKGRQVENEKASSKRAKWEELRREEEEEVEEGGDGLNKEAEEVTDGKGYTNG
jgi:hypothetical protein